MRLTIDGFCLDFYIAKTVAGLGHSPWRVGALTLEGWGTHPGGLGHSPWRLGHSSWRVGALTLEVGALTLEGWGTHPGGWGTHPGGWGTHPGGLGHSPWGVGALTLFVLLVLFLHAGDRLLDRVVHELLHHQLLLGKVIVDVLWRLTART